MEIEDIKNIRKWKSYKEMTSYMACAIAEGFCEGEDATEKEKASAWQYLLDTGQCWHLQGWYGRTAEQLLEEGLLLPPKEVKAGQ